MTHPNTKKLYEVPDECFLVFHPRTKRRSQRHLLTGFLNYFFLNEMSRRTDTHCQQGKNTGPHTPPKGEVRTKDEYEDRGGGQGWIQPLSVWRGVSKKNVIHQADFLAGILRCLARELFEYLMCFFSFSVFL